MCSVYDRPSETLERVSLKLVVLLCLYIYIYISAALKFRFVKHTNNKNNIYIIYSYCGLKSARKDWKEKQFCLLRIWNWRITHNITIHNYDENNNNKWNVKLES